jgi:protoporphyrinogen oxidase
MAEIAVIGAGPMGLLCAYELLKKGENVSIFEADNRIGGMSATFDFDGIDLERYYHFICKTDFPLFKLLEELELSDKLRWTDTKMGFFCEGDLYPWGSPINLLRFPKLGLFNKLRYGAHMFYASKIKSWDKLESKKGVDWIKKWVGNKTYDVLWERLFDLKLHEYKDVISAPWIGARIRRMAHSRKSIFKETLGYLEGGSSIILQALEKKIKDMGGEIHLNSPVSKGVVKNKKIIGVDVNGKIINFDKVISTIPLPYVSKIFADLSEKTKSQIDEVINIGVACVVLKLKKPISPYFWMNISDSRIDVPGIIEYTNLRPMDNHIAYVPYYMPQGHPKYGWSKDKFIKEVIGYIKLINPNFTEDWIISDHVSKYFYAQTVCTPNFLEKLPSMKTEIQGFYMADTGYYYPEDRSISESVQVGSQLAEMV